MLRDILRQLLTESDNVTHDLYRYLAVVSIAVGLGLSVYSVLKGQPFDMQTFGIPGLSFMTRYARGSDADYSHANSVYMRRDAAGDPPCTTTYQTACPVFGLGWMQPYSCQVSNSRSFLLSPGMLSSGACCRTQARTESARRLATNQTEPS